MPRGRRHVPSEIRVKAAADLANGHSIASTARRAEVARGTIRNWMKDPEFATTIATIRGEQLQMATAVACEGLAFMLERLANTEDPPKDSTVGTWTSVAKDIQKQNAATAADGIERTGQDKLDPEALAALADVLAAKLGIEPEKVRAALAEVG